MMEKVLEKVKFYTDEEQAWFYFWYERFKRTGKIEYPSYVDGEDIPQGMVEIMNEVINFHRFAKALDSVMMDDGIPDQLSGVTYEDNKYGYDGGFTGDLSKSSRTDTNKDIKKD